ncbi:MAG: tRNA dihydrouridine synthase DusB [Alphaproteobacteria bacterium]|nr:tRNA dihydrouridine synthase DusB [Alphaproteobacteria bacterium]
MKQICIGNITLNSSVILAPMAGVTDYPFRQIVRRFGNFLMYSEMIASYAAIRDVHKTRNMMDTRNDPLTAVQLVGAEPKVMAEAAKLSYDLGAKILDINMGCPVRKIVKSEAGSALMKNEKLASEIIKSVVESVPIPVTLKIRLGWDNDHLNAPNIAHIAEDLGIKMITVHGRTRAQLYSGKSDWKYISKVKEKINIPLIVNGDIVSIETAKQALIESGADGVMIGRASLGKPWLLKYIDDALSNREVIEISNEEKYNTAKNNIQCVLDYYPANINRTLAKKTLMYYCKGHYNATKYRSLMSNPEINTSQDLFNILDKLYDRL